MSYQALYRKWRPVTFDEVVGQEHITQTLKNEIKTGRISHAYLFTGIRGTGKTSIAKIMSRAVNCLNNTDGNPCNQCEICKGIADGTILDVVEIDAASNNGVDNIRNIRDEVVYSASSARFKIYIIDEVHMLSTQAFNALLKTLEEPPSHVIFILATTEVQKLPQTILSRCQRFDFRTITADDVANQLEKISLADGFKIDRDALLLMADMAEGSMRDALSILDKCMSFGQLKMSYDEVTDILGVADEKVSIEIMKAISRADVEEALKLLDKAISGGRNPSQIIDGLLKTSRNMLIVKFTSKENTASELEIASTDFTKEKLINCINIFTETLSMIKFSSTPKITLELSIIKLCMPVYDSSVESMADRIAALEKQIEQGVSIKVKARAVAEPQTAEKPKKNKAVKIKFSGEYSEKWSEIIAEVKLKNPGLPGFLKKLTPAGNSGTLVLAAETEDGERSINFINNDKFKNIILDAVETVCGERPNKIEFVNSFKEAGNDDFLNELKKYDFIEIYD